MTHHHVMVDKYAKWYDYFGGCCIKLGMVNEFSLTLACDHDLGHMNLDQVHDSMSCFGGHLC